MLFLCQTASELLMYYVYIPLLVLVFLGSCRLLFGKGRVQFVYALYSINRVCCTHIRVRIMRGRDVGRFLIKV